MKKIIVLLMSIVLVFGLLSTGCSSSKGAVADNGSKVVKFRVSGQHAPDDPATIKLMEVAAEIEEKTEGRVEMTVYPSNQLGDPSLVQEEVMVGSIDIAQVFMYSQFDQRFEINSVPCLATNYDDLKKIYAPGSSFYSNFERILDENDLKLLGCYVEGFIGVASKEIPEKIAEPAVNNDILIRVPGSEVYKNTGVALGYNTTTIPYADLYSALQTGVADGWLGGTALMNYLQFRDVINYWIPYNVTVENTTYIMNKDSLEMLSETDQKILIDAFNNAALDSIDEVKNLEAEAIENLKEAGVEIVELSDDDMNSIASYVREQVWPEFAEIVGEELFDDIIEDIK